MTVQEYVEKLFEYLLITPDSLEVTEDENYVFVNIQVTEDDAGKLIGKYGDTLAGLSHLITSSLRPTLGDKRVIVDVNEYKLRREELSEQEGFAAAERAVATQRPQHLPRSWQSHQRRAVHASLKDYNGVFTQSEGEGMDRHLVVYPESFRDQVSSPLAE